MDPSNCAAVETGGAGALRPVSGICVFSPLTTASNAESKSIRAQRKIAGDPYITHCREHWQLKTLGYKGIDKMAGG